MLPFFPPNKQQSGHVASFMHSCIKSTATRENRPSVRAVCALEQRLTILIVKVIKPINAVLCAACHWVDCTLYFCRPFHEHYENDKICKHCLHGRGIFLMQARCLHWSLHQEIKISNVLYLAIWVHGNEKIPWVCFNNRGQRWTPISFTENKAWGKKKNLTL